MRSPALISLIATALLAGCGGVIPEKISSQPQEYEVVASNRFKRFAVDLRNTATQEVLRNQQVRMDCPTTNRAKVGSKWMLTEATYRGREGRIFRKAEGLNPLCSSMNTGIRVRVR